MLSAPLAAETQMRQSTIICHHASLYIGLASTTLITDAVGVIELS